MPSLSKTRGKRRPQLDVFEDATIVDPKRAEQLAQDMNATRVNVSAVSANKSNDGICVEAPAVEPTVPTVIDERHVALRVDSQAADTRVDTRAVHQHADSRTAETRVEVPVARNIAEVATKAPNRPSTEDTMCLRGGNKSHRRAPGIATGTVLEEFELGDVLGQGGMGVVVSAFDTKNKRDVAVKLLRVQGETEMVQSARKRLFREARAMAKIDHPNVIKVFAFGSVGVDVYIAMEYMAEGTLRNWVRHVPRPWQDILDKFVDAGKGLGAAHDAGLVHRDFKPDNVLLGPGKRVVVTDFGLVRADAEFLEASAGFDRLTQTGEMLGTPHYMAPEQFRGKQVDARADQFAFCVALYEALYDRRPFSGNYIWELLAQTSKGQSLAPPDDTCVPAFIGRAIMRGLSPEPSDRFASMSSLLQALTTEQLDDDAAMPPQPQDRPRRWIVPAAAAVAIAVGVVLAFATM